MMNATPVFSSRETAWHRTARFTFVPWVARLLGNGPLRGTSEALPIGNPEGLTDETVDAIRDMINRACWQFLARDCGWRRRFAVAPDGGYGRRRMWEAGLPELKFTEASIDLLLAVFRHTRPDETVETLVPPEPIASNGDSILDHLVFRRLTGANRALGIGSDFSWNAWYRNPLNALFHVRSFQGTDPADPSWGRLFEPDLAPFLPWVGARLAADWRSRREDTRQNLPSAANWFNHLATALNRLIETASGRPDLLIFLFDAFAAEADTANSDAERFEQETKSLNRSQREETSIPWSRFLRIPEDLRELHQSCIGLHPVERGGAEHCFLAAWEAVEFSGVVDRLRKLRQRIRPAIS